jgi:SAM-dependent methyltransferase
VPYIVETLRPQSVVDVGCGPGSWLAVAIENGVPRVVGIDGDWVDREQLEIPLECFIPRDLVRDRIRLDETFDLAISLEVGEHLPTDQASAFVRELVTLAPIVLFSAAVPFQGGTDHRNEQWPVYWERLFEEHDYVGVDCVRPRFWNDERVRYFYAQNTLLYVERARLKQLRKLGGAFDLDEPICSLVHPHLYLNALRRFPAPEDVDIRGLGRFLARWAMSWGHPDRRA